MDDYVRERVELVAVEYLQQHLSECLDILASHATSGKVWQVDLQRIDARLLVCRQHIAMLGDGYSTAED
jgi:hypothetical protein